MSFSYSKNQEKSQQVEFSQENRIHYPTYGRYLEDFEEGMVFEHPRGITLTAGFIYDFAMTFFEANPIYINKDYALAYGYRNIPASPLLVMNIILSLGVQNNSERAYANLGYYNMSFYESVYAGDTLRAITKIQEKKVREEGKPGIITLHTVGVNQNNKVVIQYDRKIMVLPRPKEEKPREYRKGTFDFPDVTDTINVNVPSFSLGEVKRHAYLTGHNTFYEDFQVGDVIVTHNGRSMSDEHFAWTYKLGNTHPLHFDKIFTEQLSGAMSGMPIIYGGLIFAWLLGLASRDISENAIWDCGYTEGYHTQPAKTGDTISVIHRVIGEEPIDNTFAAGIKQFQVIGIQGMQAKAALDKYGADLFVKENSKKKIGKEKIPEKIFEIERRLLIKKRP